MVVQWCPCSRAKTSAKQLYYTGERPPGLVTANGDTITGVTETSTGAAALATVGTYNIVSSAATGNRLSNYTITYRPGTLLVTPAPLVITANSANKMYDALAGTVSQLHRFRQRGWSRESRRARRWPRQPQPLALCCPAAMPSWRQVPGTLIMPSRIDLAPSSSPRPH